MPLHAERRRPPLRQKRPNKASRGTGGNLMLCLVAFMSIVLIYWNAPKGSDERSNSNGSWSTKKGDEWKTDVLVVVSSEQEYDFELLRNSGFNTWRANRVWRGGECLSEEVCSNGVFDYLQYLMNDIRPTAEMIVFLSGNINNVTIERMTSAIERSRKSQQYETIETLWIPQVFKKITTTIPQRYNDFMAPQSISYCLWHCRHPRKMDVDLPVIDTSLSASFVVPSNIFSRYEVLQNLIRIKKLNRGSTVEVGYLRWSWRFFFNGNQIADPFPNDYYDEEKLRNDVISVLNEYIDPEYFIIYTAVLPNNNFAQSMPAIATGRIGRWPTMAAVLSVMAKLLKDEKYSSLIAVVIMTRNEVNNIDLTQHMQEAIDCSTSHNRLTPISRTWSFSEWASKISSPLDAERWNLVLDDFYELHGKTMGYIGGSVIPTRLLSQKVSVLERFTEAVQLYGGQFESSTLHIVFDESPDIELKSTCGHSFTTIGNTILQTLADVPTLPWNRRLKDEKIDEMKWIFESGIYELSDNGKLYNITSNSFGMWTVGNSNKDSLVVVNRGPPNDISGIRALLLKGYNIWMTRHPQRFSSIDTPHGHLIYLSDPERPISDYVAFIQGGLDNVFYQPLQDDSIESSVTDAINCIKVTQRYTPLARLWFPIVWSTLTKKTAAVWNEIVSHKNDINLNIRPMQLHEPVLSYDSGGQFVVTREMILERGRQNLWIRLLRDVVDEHRKLLFPYVWHFIFGENQTVTPSNECSAYLSNTQPSPDLKSECAPLTGNIRHNSFGCWTENNDAGWKKDILIVLTGDANYRQAGAVQFQKHRYNTWVPITYGNCSKFGSSTYGFSCREGYSIISYLADPHRPEADYVIFCHSHVVSWHQKGTIFESIQQALPIARKARRSVSLNNKYFPEEWNIRTNTVAAEYNAAVIGTGSRLMNQSIPLLSQCCTQAVVPIERLHRNMNFKGAAKLLELMQRNLTYSGWWFEYVFHFVIGEDENNEMYRNHGEYLLPVAPTSFIAESEFTHLEADCITPSQFGVLLKNSKASVGKTLPLVVVGDAYQRSDMLDSFVNGFLLSGHGVYLSREPCPIHAGDVCASSWGYVSFLAGRDRPPSDGYILFINSNINYDQSIDKRITKALNLFSVIEKTDCNVTAIPLFPEKFVTVAAGSSMASEIASAWNKNFGDLQAKMSAQRPFAIYPSQFLTTSSTLNTYHEAYTVSIRIWRELHNPFSTMSDSLQYLWLFLFIRRQQMGLPMDSNLTWPHRDWVKLLMNEGCLNSYRLFE